jgi:hypothetical protein
MMKHLSEMSTAELESLKAELYGSVRYLGRLLRGDLDWTARQEITTCHRLNAEFRNRVDDELNRRGA